jgi:GntR family transcriptional regulator
MAQKELAPEQHPTPFSTDPKDELPVGLQLSWRLRALIAAGRLASGDQLPSFRRLAEWAGVNVNTVRAVYAGLEDEGLVVSRHGQGTFVADGVEPVPQIEAIAADALRSARDAGIDPRDLAVVAMACAGMSGALEEDGPALPTTGADLPDLSEASEVIEVRHELRRQIGRLEAELASYVRDLPDDRRTAPRSAEAHVAGVEELELTRDALIAQLSDAQRAAELRARQEGEARARRKAVLTGPDRGDRTQEDAEPLGKAMSWWRAKS